MATAKQGDKVKVHYTGTLDDGTIFDSSAERDPLEFTIGEGQIIPGFEQAVIGLEPGEETTEKIGADDAYGPRRDNLVLKVEREQIPPEIQPQVNMQLEIQQEDGGTIPVLVTDMDDQSVTLDANHPLAGQDLTFKIELVEIV